MKGNKKKNAIPLYFQYVNCTKSYHNFVERCLYVNVISVIDTMLVCVLFCWGFCVCWTREEILSFIWPFARHLRWVFVSHPFSQYFHLIYSPFFQCDLNHFIRFFFKAAGVELLDSKLKSVLDFSFSCAKYSVTFFFCIWKRILEVECAK